MSTDRIEKQVVLRAPRSRVWRALTDAKEFGAWFGVKLRSGFTAGARVQGQITYPGYEHVTLDITIVRLDPETDFSWRWHPNAVDPGVDYSKEPTTLVELHLEEVEGGTRLTVVESGFDGIPLARRAEAFEANDGGWAEQIENIRRHVSA
jgi:uncharacterized protein YndB with AHSA1/START domain